MESSEQNSAYISPPICSNRLIFNFPETNILENEGKEKFYWTWREDQNKSFVSMRFLELKN